MASKLWMGHGANGLCRDCWYGVGLVKAVARSIGGNALINPHRALPGTILDIKASGVTVAVANGAVRLSNFLTPLGRPLHATQLPLSVGQRLPRLTPYQQRAIAQFEDGIATYEAAWHQRLTQLRPLRLPIDEAEPGLGSIFARLPLDLEPVLAQGSPAFQDALAQHGASVLMTALTAYLMGLRSGKAGSCQAANLLEEGNTSSDTPGNASGGVRCHDIDCHDVDCCDVGLRNIRLQQRLCSEELTALFASHVPARFELDLAQSFAHNLMTVLKELRFLETALTHRQDLALGVNDAKLPSLYPILMEVVTEISEAPHRLGQALTLQVADNGAACVWFYNPAVLGEEDVARMQAEFVTGLRAIAQDPEMPMADGWQRGANLISSSLT